LPLIYDSVTNNSGADYSSSTGMFTATQPGYYQVNASIGINAGDLSDFTYQFGGALELFVNGTPIASGPFVQEAELISGNLNSIVISQSSISTIVYMNTGDKLNCALAYITTAPNNRINTYTNLIPNSFRVCWIRGT
jgi:hypothetical protein